MKKKLLSLIFLCALVLSTLTVSAADNVDGTTARTDLLAGKAYILDVRSNKVHDEKGNLDHLAGTYHLPVFDADNSTTSDAAVALQADFTAYVKANREELAKKPIYILCNSGRSGAAKASELLAAEGLDNYHTITNGAKDLEIRYEFLNTNNTVDGPTTVAAFDGDNAIVLDVRNTATYNKGHLAGSLSLPVFDANNSTISDEAVALQAEFTKTVTNNAELAGKDIYVLCNSGARGARAATVLLKDAGYALEDIFTVTGGANKNDVVKAALVPTVSEYKFVDGSTTVKADPAKTVVIDVRSTVNFAKGNLTGSVNWPLFTDDNKVTNGRDALAKAFIETVKANAELLAGKNIYILCNSGARGAQNATQLLAFAGYNVATTEEGVVYTIKGGAKDLEVRYAFLNTNNAVSGADTVAAIGNKEVAILDVRNNANYGKAHLKGALHIPVFTEAGSPVGTASDDLAKAFLEAVKDNADLQGKKIYIVCNSGARGARAATVLLTDAGYALENIYTVTGGAKDAVVAAASTYVSGEFTVSKLADSNYLVLDVRNAENYAKGHLEGSLSLPVFDKDNKLPDDLAKAFSDYVAANKAKFEGKTILVICNSGARGAVKATELLKAAGYTNVFTVENGAKSAVKDSFVTDKAPAKPSSPQTGDPANDVATVSPMMVVAFVMVAAVIAVVRKREYTK